MHATLLGLGSLVDSALLAIEIVTEALVIETLDLVPECLNQKEDCLLPTKQSSRLI